MHLNAHTHKANLMCPCIHIHTYVYTCTNTYIHSRIHMHTHIHVYICTLTYLANRIHIHTYIHNTHTHKPHFPQQQKKNRGSIIPGPRSPPPLTQQPHGPSSNQFQATLRLFRHTRQGDAPRRRANHRQLHIMFAFCIRHFRCSAAMREPEFRIPSCNSVLQRHAFVAQLEVLRVYRSGDTRIRCARGTAQV
jgi:hypothetical protein